MQTFPPWLSKKVLKTDNVRNVSALLKKARLNTVCQSAQCPNKDECFERGHATFLILGDVCTRGCLFCGVKKGVPGLLDKDEPQRIARFVKERSIHYVVITSVTRDDLQDGGAAEFANTIKETRQAGKDIKIEVLTPEFRLQGLRKVIEARPDVFSHNIETVPRLYKKLRPNADYNRSLGFLKNARGLNSNIAIKSGVMVGLGETERELLSVLADLKEAGCSAITMGQYLRPSKKQVGVSKFVHPRDFKRYEKAARDIGFKSVLSGPFIRSSYIN